VNAVGRRVVQVSLRCPEACGDEAEDEPARARSFSSRRRKYLRSAQAPAEACLLNQDVVFG
jgi:hypothetical protein